MPGAGEAAWEPLVARCEALGRAGVEFVLVREKRMEAGELTRLVRAVVAAARPGGMKVLVAQRADVAVAAEADGVHLSGRSGELLPEQVRRVMPGAIVSVSCHRGEEVRRAAEEGASLVLFAPVFGKTVDGVEVAAGVGIESLREACGAAGGMPVLALGGVTEGNVGACVEAGAAGVAGIRMFFDVGWKSKAELMGRDTPTSTGEAA